MSAPAPIRVVIAEDAVLVREGVAAILEEAGLEVVGRVGDVPALMRVVRDHAPDLAVVDIRMPPTQTDEGLRAARAIRADHPGTGVLVLSHHVEPEYALELLADSAEGVGYLLKDRLAAGEDLADAARRVAGGGSALDPTVVSRLVGRRRGRDPVASLSPREHEVLALMAEGRSNASIAGRLVITERAVEKHVTGIFGRLSLPAAPDTHRRVLAVLAYLRAG